MRKLLEAGPPASQLSDSSASPAPEGLHTLVKRQAGSKQHLLCVTQRAEKIWKTNYSK